MAFMKVKCNALQTRAKFNALPMLASAPEDIVSDGIDFDECFEKVLPNAKKHLAQEQLPLLYQSDRNILMERATKDVSLDDFTDLEYGHQQILAMIAEDYSNEYSLEHVKEK